MSDAPTEPADAPVPPGGTEQAAAQEQDKAKAEDPSSTAWIVADAGEAVFDIVATILHK